MCANRNEKKNPPEQFYSYFKPIAIVGRICGVFPVKNLHDADCNNLQFSIVSLSMLYTTCLYLSLIITISLVTDWSFLQDDTQEQGPSVMWLIVLQCVMTIYSFLSFLYCTCNASRFVDLIKHMDLFDKQKRALFATITETTLERFWRRTLKPLICAGSLVIVIIVGVITFSTSAVEITHFGDYDVVIYIYFGILGIWQVYPILYYLIVASAICENFKFINAECQKLIPKTKWFLHHNQYLPPANIRQILRNIRYSHVLMTDCVKYLSLASGSSLAIGQLYTILTIVLVFYLTFFTKHQGVDLLIYVLVYTFLSLTVVFASHRTRVEVRLFFFLSFLLRSDCI